MQAPVTCRVAELVEQHGQGWVAIARRAGLPRHVVHRLRHRHANPSLTVAERLAHALDLPVEGLWRLAR